MWAVFLSRTILASVAAVIPDAGNPRLYPLARAEDWR